MKASLIIICLIALAACGGFKQDARKPASVVTFDRNAEIDEKLKSLHDYYLIGHAKLNAFDKSIPDHTLSELYHTRPYLELMAVRAQVEEIESNLVRNSKVEILKAKIKTFSEKSRLSKLAMEKLSKRINLKIDFSDRVISEEEITIAMTKASQSTEFKIFEKNVEHLSHLMEIKTRSHPAKKWNIDTLDWMAQHPDKIILRTKKLLNKKA